MTNEPYEWLEADGLGGFASHTSLGTRTRKYHALLLVARTPPTDRRVLVNGVDAVIDSNGERLALTSQTYKPSAAGEAAVTRYEGRPIGSDFKSSPWPTWTYALGNGSSIEHSILVPHGQPLVILSWRLHGPGDLPMQLMVRPFLSGRDYHSLQQENGGFNFSPVSDEPHGRWTFKMYAHEPSVEAVSSGAFAEDPYWYRRFLYLEEKQRGLDDSEDLGAPGTFTFELREREAVLVFGSEGSTDGWTSASIEERLAAVRSGEKARRLGASTPALRAASAYIVKRDSGKTVVAGYPWFTDWGRDTFISLRGLCLATGRLSEARQVLRQWSTVVSQGMLPNRFTDEAEAPEFNSVDASLWFIVAVHDLRAAERRAGRRPSPVEDWQINAAVVAILHGYSEGTRHGIRMDSDHLLAAGEAGTQLTWMDAKVGDHVATPRVGKPVEVQALWINALRIGGGIDGSFAEIAKEAEASFHQRFWNEDAGYLYDVIDVDHQPGSVDPRIRPNALFAVGGLPYQLTEGERASRIVDLAEKKLWTPAGPRSLSPDDPEYHGSYRGGVWSRDTAYHQGTVWPYLAGAFVEAWVRSRPRTVEALSEARRRFLEPLLARLDPHGTGHIPEIAEGDAPHLPRGCPFQAWSVGELLRLDRVVLSPNGTPNA